MFLRSLLAVASSPNADAAIVMPARRVSWTQFRSLVATMAEELAQFRGARVGVVMQPWPECFAALAAFDGLDAEVVLLNGGAPEDATLRQALELDLQAILAPQGGGVVGPRGQPALSVLPLVGGRPGCGGSSVTILSSGTTGAGKGTRHTWESLVRPVRRSPRSKRQHWLLTYRPDLYAGLQVVLQCLLVGGTLFVPEPGSSVIELVCFLQRERVAYVSATPSYWRRLLLQAARSALRELHICQITLGGEIADQVLLDSLRETFPSARIAHIYATTEVGRCFSVTDVRAGFPATLLDKPTDDGVALRIEEGELVVRPANLIKGYEATLPAGAAENVWHRTGDLVELVGDRVLFVGRVGETINVGGNKVHPLPVESILRGVPGVADVRVYAHRSSIAGHLVACEIVLAEGARREEVEDAMAQAAAAQLTTWQRPRIIDFVNAIRLTPACKTSRGQE